MNERGKSSRDRILDAANHLVYTKGFNQTSFADVADAVGITKGNLHYHFRSKEDLLNAIIDGRVERLTNELAKWDQEFPDARDKLKRFVQLLLNQEKELVRYGCPVGSLNVELGKCQVPLQDKAREMFDISQSWLQKTFKQLGMKNSKSLSQHLLAMAQGAALLSYVYSDASLLRKECKNIEQWIDSLVSK